MLPLRTRAVQILPTFCSSRFQSSINHPPRLTSSTHKPNMSLESASSQWLANNISTLLSSPYIHFPPAPKGLPMLHMGPGPVDLFTTRFENLFTTNATGVVAGKEVGRNELKECLLALQKKWNPQTAHFVDNPDQDGHEPAMTMDWRVPDAENHIQVAAEASLKDEGGARRIDSLKLDGDQSLFRV
ncbi:hypothetical protein ABKN59_009670 [Abortiporus biennis]